MGRAKRFDDGCCRFCPAFARNVYANEYISLYRCNGKQKETRSTCGSLISCRINKAGNTLLRIGDHPEAPVGKVDGETGWVKGAAGTNSEGPQLRRKRPCRC